MTHRPERKEPGKTEAFFMNSTLAMVFFAALLAWGCSSRGSGKGPNEAEDTSSSTQSTQDSPTDTQLSTDLPESCEAAGVECGVLQLRDGTWTDCGSCQSPQTCGALEPGQCGCEPLTCEWAGADCGTLDDGCGHTLECGQCSGLATCGGSLAPNVCAAPVCNDYCWCSVAPYPQGDDLSLAYFDHQDTLWVGGADGQLLARQNSGWKMVSTYTRVPSSLFSMALFGPQDGWIVGENGSILKYEGTRFHCSYLDESNKTKYWSPVEYDLFDIWAASSTSIWVAGAQGVLHWDGSKWSEARSSTGALYAVAGASEDDLWFGGTRNNAPFLLHKKGALFSPPDMDLPGLSGVIRDFARDGQGVLHAVGVETDATGASIGGFLLRQKNENSWERLDPGDLPHGLHSCAFDEHGRLFAVGEHGSVATHDGATVRMRAGLWGTANLRSVARGKDGLLVVGETGLIAPAAHGFFFPNVARSAAEPGSQGLSSVALSTSAQLSGGNGFALLWRGTSFGFAPVSAHIVGLLAFGPKTVFAAGNDKADAVILRYDGSAWTEIARAPEEETSGLEGTSTADVRARLAGNRILHYDGKMAVIRDSGDLPSVPNKPQVEPPWNITDRGFERFSEGKAELLRAWPLDGLTQMPRRAAGTSAGELWSVGKDGAMHFDGDFWRRIAANIDLSDVVVDSEGVAWFTGTASSSGGPLWRFEAGALVDAGFDAETTLNAISLGADGTLFVAGEGIYQREGQEWLEVLPGNGTPVLAVGAVGETDVWAGRGFDVLHLHNGTWTATPTTDIQDIMPLSDDPRVVVHTIVPLAADEILIAGDTYDKRCMVMVGFVHGSFSSRPMCSMYGQATMNDVWALSADDAYVTVGQVGWVFHYIHAIGMFDTVDAVTAEPLGALWGNGQGYKWAFGANGVISRGVPFTDAVCQ
jgi:hypothetical protein